MNNIDRIKIISGIFEYSKSFLRQITEKGFFHLLSANVLIQIFGFGSQFFVAWILSPEQIGQIRVMQTYLNLSTILATLGFNTSTLKLCSEKRDEGEIVYLYQKAFKYTTISLVLTFILMLFLAKYELLSNDKNVNRYLPYFLLALFPVTLNSVDFTYLQARKKIKEIGNIQSLTKLFSLFIVVLITFWLEFDGYIIAIVLGYCITFVLFYKKTITINREVDSLSIPNPFKIHWNYARFSFSANILGQIGSYADILLMNFLIRDKAMLGYYSFAITMAMGGRMFSSTIQQIITPYLSEKSSSAVDLKASYKKYYKIFILSMTSILLISVVIFPFIIDLIFNNKYHKSIDFFYLLIIANFLQSFYIFEGITLLAIGKINLNFYSSIITTIFNIIVVFIMVTHYDVLGAAYAMIINAIFGIIVTKIYFYSGMKDIFLKNV